MMKHHLIKISSIALVKNLENKLWASLANAKGLVDGNGETALVLFGRSAGGRGDWLQPHPSAALCCRGVPAQWPSLPAFVVIDSASVLQARARASAERWRVCCPKRAGRFTAYRAAHVMCRASAAICLTSLSRRKRSMHLAKAIRRCRGFLWDGVGMMVRWGKSARCF